MQRKAYVQCENFFNICFSVYGNYFLEIYLVGLLTITCYLFYINLCDSATLIKNIYLIKTRV